MRAARDLPNHAFGVDRSGGAHTVGVTTSAQALAWGRNPQGQLGDGTTSGRLVPTSVAGSHTFRSLSAGTLHTVGVTTTGRALAWGWNEYGQLGDGTTTDRWVPTPVAGGLTFR
jgi:alpha-tubulin suppressor-like RCC1 family protein